VQVVDTFDSTFSITNAESTKKKQLSKQ